MIGFARASVVAALLLAGAASPAAAMTPAEAGTRYGQALGVALVCYGMKTTEAVQKLAANYTGDDAKSFQAAADKTLINWQEAKSCVKAGSPNACRLIHEWSCRDALREIGPEGAALPGLVAPAN